jgi:glycosyltransferase involved in cell wall biosynthesis
LKRIAFLLESDQNRWLGGLSYIRNLLRAILSNPDRQVEPVLLAHPALATGFFSGFPAIEMVRTTLANHRHPARLASRASLRLMGRDLTLERLLRRHRIDALSHSFTVGMRSSLASIGWIPDFQHIRMPELFSQRECDARNDHYLRLVEGSRRIILSSNDARRDFTSFAPRAAHKAAVLHFVSAFQDTGTALTREQVLNRFGIDSPFFHVPNQFWAHKNHGVIIEALGILRKRGINALVLATGNTVDYRTPKYLFRLMTRAKELGIEDSFRVLGVVTLPELQALMLNSLALINPSNFEGWSTTVEESKSLGLPIILSDIPVHLEQAPPLGRYFRANSAEDLADLMLAAMRDYDPTVAAKAREEAASNLPERIQRFGRAYEEIASRAIEND